MVLKIANHLVFLLHFGFRFVSLHNSLSHFLIFFFKCSHFIYLSVWCVKLMLQIFTIPCVLILKITNHLNLVFLYTLFLYLLHCTTLILTFSFFFLKCFHLFFFNVMSWCYKSSHLVFCVAQLPFWIFK